ncbi:MAG: hypothetical protein EOO60_13435 [Hymenobacter sp.]|nr:MAG: hypothetical protein EOO60_13435 [Hymenobacter sp.]
MPTKEAATPANIAVIEQQYGFTLPTDYKAHILVANGGRSQRRSIQADGDHVTRDISAFYSVWHGISTLESLLKLLHDQLPPDLVPFGRDAGGDQFGLSMGATRVVFLNANGGR